jgi:hypothetical protein
MLKSLSTSSIKNQISFFVMAAALMILGSVLYQQSHSNAVTNTRLKSNVVTERYRVTYQDIKAGADQGTSARKKITVFTLSGGDQILSIATKTSAAFVVPGVENTITESVVAEIGGNVVSDSNIMLPPSLSEPNFENTKGGSNEFLFFDETSPTDITMTVSSGDGVASLDSLTGGQIDFYVTKVQ